MSLSGPLGAFTIFQKLRVVISVTESKMRRFVLLSLSCLCVFVCLMCSCADCRQWLTIALAKTEDGSKAKTGATIVQLSSSADRKDFKSNSSAPSSSSSSSSAGGAAAAAGKKGQKNKCDASEQPTPKRLKTNTAAAASASSASAAAADVEEIVQQGQNPDDY